MPQLDLISTNSDGNYALAYALGWARSPYRLTGKDTGRPKYLEDLNPLADRNAIYIAPTNALIEQQTEAATKFIQETGLPHVVKAASARQVKSWPDDRVGKRSGEKLYNLLREPATIFPECAGKPLLLVTNPDIFYYAAFFQYAPLDRSNIASVFYNSFGTVIFDEFHIYDAKQLVSLLFYLALSKVFRDKSIL